MRNLNNDSINLITASKHCLSCKFVIIADVVCIELTV